MTAKAAGFYEVQVFVERWPNGPADYLNAVVEFIRPWESSPLTPRYHEGWLNLYEVQAGKWVMWSVHQSRLGPMQLGTKVDAPS